MREVVATMTSKGQVTVPAEVRRLLGLGPGAKVAFVIEDGQVRVRPQRFTLETVLGSVEPLTGPNAEDFEAQIEEAMADEADQIVRTLESR